MSMQPFLLHMNVCSEGSEEMMCCEFSYDGTLLAVGTSCGTVTVS